MRVSGWRRLRSHRAWWPVALAVLGAPAVALWHFVREADAGGGIAGPLVATGLVAAFSGLLTGVAEGIVQPSVGIRDRVRTALVVLALLAAAVLGGGPLGAALAALLGSGVALGARRFGLGVMAALVGRDIDED